MHTYTHTHVHTYTHTHIHTYTQTQPQPQPGKAGGAERREIRGCERARVLGELEPVPRIHQARAPRRGRGDPQCAVGRRAMNKGSLLDSVISGIMERVVEAYIVERNNRWGRRRGCGGRGELSGDGSARSNEPDNNPNW